MADNGINWRDFGALALPGGLIGGLRTVAAGPNGTWFGLGDDDNSGERRVLEDGQLFGGRQFRDNIDAYRAANTFEETMGGIQGVLDRRRDALRQRRGAARDRREDEFNEQLDQLIASIAAPSLDLSAFDMAEGQANEAYDKALPVIQGETAHLLQALQRYAGEGRREGRESSRQSAQEGREATNEARGLSRSILADLVAQSGSDGPVGSLVNAAGADAATQEQAIRSGTRDERAYQRDITRNEQTSIRGQRGDARTVGAAAAADARNNLDAILGSIGVERAGAQAQHAQQMAEYQNRIAEMRFGAQQDFQAGEDARVQQRRENRIETQGAAQEQAVQMRQAQAEVANDFVGQIQTAVEGGADPVQAMQQLVSVYGPGIQSGDNPTGQPLDLEAIMAQVQRYVQSLGTQAEAE